MSGQRPAPDAQLQDPAAAWRGWWCGFERLWPALWPTLAVARHVRCRCRCSGCGSACRWRCICRCSLAFVGALGVDPLACARRPRAWPAATRGLARLEQDSGVTHQPLRALDDTLPGDFRDPATRRLWALHRQRLITSLERLRLAPPRSDLPRRDPWALRAALLLVLVRGAGPWPRRARPAPGQRLHLRRPSGRGGLPPAVDLWITPPAYTRRAPLVSEQTRGLAALAVPTRQRGPGAGPPSGRRRSGRGSLLASRRLAARELGPGQRRSAS